MSEERLKVLGMVASGRITVEQANQLLETMGIEEGRPDDDVSVQSTEATKPLKTPAKDERAESMFGDFTFSQAIQMSVQGVTPDDIARIQAAGLNDLSFEEMIQMSILGVEPEFVVNARRSELDLDFEQILQLGTVGIDPTYIQQVRQAGLDDLTFEEIVQMGTLDVDPAFLVELRTAGQA